MTSANDNTMNEAAQPDFIDRILRYETGQMSYDETIVFFQTLIDTGMAWTLQGHYGRMATDLIRARLVTRKEVQCTSNV